MATWSRMWRAKNKTIREKWKWKVKWKSATYFTASGLIPTISRSGLTESQNTQHTNGYTGAFRVSDRSANYVEIMLFSLYYIVIFCILYVFQCFCRTPKRTVAAATNGDPNKNNKQQLAQCQDLLLFSVFNLEWITCRTRRLKTSPLKSLPATFTLI